MELFGYDIYLSKNIDKNKIEKLLSDNYHEYIFLYTDFLNISIDVEKQARNCAYFYIHHFDKIIDSQFPFRLQMESLLDEPSKWEKAYCLTEKICKIFNLCCFIEYPFNTQKPSPYDVLLYLPNGEIHVASDIDYDEKGELRIVRLLDI